MESILFAILILVCILSLLEDKMQRYNRIVYMMLTVVLILLAGFREIGADRDSENYEYFFNNYDSPEISFAVEYSYIFLSHIFNFISNDVHSIFLFYAIIGVSLKMIAFRRISGVWFLPVAVYLGYYYLLHDLTQMRASIVSGLTLCSIPFIYNGQRKIAMGLLLLGCFFHYSAIALLPIAFISRKEMSGRERWIWAAIVPFGYLAYFAQVNIMTQIQIPYITEKLEIYETLRDKGIAGDEINVFNLVFIVKCVIYFYVLFFYDTIALKNKYLPIIMRIMGLSIFVYLFFAQFPILSIRLSELYGIVQILVYTYIFYTIRPQWAGLSIVCMLSITLFIIYVFVQKIFEAS